MCLAGGTWLLSRSILILYYPDYYAHARYFSLPLPDIIFFSSLFYSLLIISVSDINDVLKPLAANATIVPKETEWLKGNELCTYRGVKHLAWSVPMV
jgi:hypothetical protein